MLRTNLCLVALLAAAPAVAENCQSTCPHAAKAMAAHQAPATHHHAAAAMQYATPAHPTKVMAAKPIMEPKAADLVETAASAGQFNTLLAAAQAAGLVDALKGDGPLTVFAPTDEAFAKIPAETIQSLLKPENKDQLTAILTYHVVPGRVLAKDVVGLRSAKTLQGSEVAVGVASGRVYLNNAQVLKTDINTSNGVIHVIDTVLMPAG